MHFHTTLYNHEYQYQHEYHHHNQHEKQNHTMGNKQMENEMKIANETAYIYINISQSLIFS